MNHRRPTMPPSFKTRVAGTCRWCGLAIPKGVSGIYWHPECVKTYRIACFSQDQRAAVFERDKGVCAACGIDCERIRLRHSWQRIERRWGLRWDDRYSVPSDQWKRRDARFSRRYGTLRRALEERRRESCAAGWGSAAYSHNEGAWWQADHIMPLLEAEGRIEYFLLANLQTLCHRCHQAKGKADRARQKEAKRKASQPEMAIA